MSPEKELITGILFMNVVFLLFLYANYQYIFKLGMQSENKK
ncbi:MAG: hypothetical protein Q7K40_03610 [bacterium]|nr:hypothetical protein [bacterium]